MVKSFGDSRGLKVALLAHCILNQNSVVAGLARERAMILDLIKVLNELGVGVIQLPCPELMHSGLRRFWQVKEQYGSVGFRKYCRVLAEGVADVVEEFSRNGVEVVALIGIAGSPSCGIRTTTSGDWMGDPRGATSKSKVPGAGVFMEELMEELRRRGVDVKVIEELDYSDIEGSVERIEGKIRECVG